jgi:hypothetical protein
MFHASFLLLAFWKEVKDGGRGLFFSPSNHGMFWEDRTISSVLGTMPALMPDLREGYIGLHIDRNARMNHPVFYKHIISPFSD